MASRWTSLTCSTAECLWKRRDSEPLITHVHLSSSTGEKVHVPLAEGIYDLAAPLGAIGKFFGGIAAIESYSPGKELESAAENKKEFDRLMATDEPASPERP